MDNNKNPYYQKRVIDRINQAGNYLNDAVEFLKRAVKELDPVICSMCPKEALYFYGNAKACEEHVPDEVKTAVSFASSLKKEGKDVISKESVDNLGKVIIKDIKEKESK